MQRTTATPGTTPQGALRFSLTNWAVLLLGVLCILAGYVLLSSGSTVAAPLLLVLGYVVLLPLGIIL